MSKATPGKGAPSQPGAAAASKAPKLKKREAYVAAGNRVRVKGEDRGEGRIVSVEDFAIDGETDGQAAFDRALERGRITTDAVDEGGAVAPGDQIASTPSAAQIIAALHDPEVAKVVAAHLSGSKEAFQEAANEGTGQSGEPEKAKE